MAQVEGAQPQRITLIVETLGAGEGELVLVPWSLPSSVRPQRHLLNPLSCPCWHRLGAQEAAETWLRVLTSSAFSNRRPVPSFRGGVGGHGGTEACPQPGWNPRRPGPPSSPRP